jgi:vacuolar-type H+-ATPase subunit I/STV1
MKISLIFGIIHMTFGVMLSLWNQVNFMLTLTNICEYVFKCTILCTGTRYATGLKIFEQCCGSVTFWYGSGSVRFFAYWYFLYLHLHHVSMINSHELGHKTVGIKVFLTIFA